MKVLIDECLPHKLRLHLEKHETVTAVYSGFGGLKNGELLDAAEAAGFDVVITSDLGMQYQQNVAKRKLAVVELSAQGWEIVKNNIGMIADAVDTAKLGTLTRVDIGTFSRKRKSGQASAPRAGHKSQA